jgi:hypothetical protein
MLQARLIAVDHVEIEAAPMHHVELEWFYGTLIGLRSKPQQTLAVHASLPPPAIGEDLDTQQLRFRGERFELRIRLCEEPTLEAVEPRVQLEVRGLEDLALVLDERHYPYEWQRGINFTDRALLLLDPAGNRVLLRQLWGFQPV